MWRAQWPGLLMRALLSAAQGLQPQAAAAQVLWLVRQPVPLVWWLALLLLAALALQLQLQVASALAVAAGR